MLTKEEREIFRVRAQMVLDNLRRCNSGADIHKVGNMRSIANLILELVECDTAHSSTITPVLNRLEKAMVEYFKDKFKDLD